MLGRYNLQRVEDSSSTKVNGYVQKIHKIYREYTKIIGKRYHLSSIEIFILESPHLLFVTGRKREGKIQRKLHIPQKEEKSILRELRKNAYKLAWMMFIPKMQRLRF